MIIGFGQRIHKDYAALQDKVVIDVVARPSYDQRVKENAWIRNMDSKDFQWSKIDVFFNFRNDSGGEAYGFYNWKNPATAKITKAGTVTYTPMAGEQGNGTNGRLAVGQNLDAGSNLVVSTAQISLCFDLVIQGAGSYVCGLNGSGQNYFFATPTGNAKLVETSGSIGITVVNPGAGHWILNKVANNSNAAYKNGSLDAGPSAVNDQVNEAQPLYLFCRNTVGTAQGFSTSQLGYICYGARVLSPGQFNQSLQIFKS